MDCNRLLTVSNMSRFPIIFFLNFACLLHFMAGICKFTILLSWFHVIILTLICTYWSLSREISYFPALYLNISQNNCWVHLQMHLNASMIVVHQNSKGNVEYCMRCLVIIIEIIMKFWFIYIQIVNYW